MLFYRNDIATQTDMDNLANHSRSSQEGTTAVNGSINDPPSFPPPPLPSEELALDIDHNSISKAFIEDKADTKEIDKLGSMRENDNSSLSYNKESISATNSVIDPGLR